MAQSDRSLARMASSCKPLLIALSVGPLAFGASCSPARTDRSPAPTARGDTKSPPDTPLQHDSARAIVFRAQELPFRYERGESGAAWPVETTGGGVGLLDYDGDGDLDLFFAQGVPLPVGKSKDPPADVLLRNDG